MDKFDAVIIGSGQGGQPLAVELAGAGWKTALVEKAHLGGSCINYGCTPTKTLIASAQAAHMVKRSSDYGVNTNEPMIDMEKIRERKHNIVESFRGGLEKKTENTDNLELFEGEARFEGSKEIIVTSEDGRERSITADKIIINTGARPAQIPIDGLEDVNPLDSTSIQELDVLPEHLLILGGGYIGLEFGQYMRRLGSDVTIIEKGAQLAGREDEDIAEEIAKIFQEDGINLIFNAEAKRFTETDDSHIELTYKKDGDEKKITGSHVLAAIGRQPNTDMLNLSKAGVESFGHGFIKVNDKLETSAKGIYAIGDVKGGPAFTHISYDDYRVLKENLLNDGNRSIKDRLVPYTIFIDPQLGRVGLSEKEAKEKGIDYKKAEMPMEYVARAIEVDQTRGKMKVLVDPSTHLIIGCAILGIEGGEIMNMIQIAMMAKMPYTEIRDGIFAHPTLGESLNNLFAQIKE